MVADIKSIVIYFGAVALTLVFLRHCVKSKNQMIFCSFLRIFITTLPLSLLAGLKAPTVGTDSYNYIMIFHGIYKRSISECFLQSDYEVGFVVLVKILSMIFGEVDARIFFALECISLITFIYALLNIKDKINPCLTFFLYFLVFYHSSLNIIRQGLAISFITLLITKLVKKKFFQSVVIWAVSVSIHLSSIIAILFILTALILKKYQELSIKRIVFIGAIFLMLGGFYFGWNYIMALPIFSSYARYNGKQTVGVGVFITGIIYLGIPFILCKNDIFSAYESEVLFDIALMFIPIAFLGYFAEYAARLNLFPRIAIILFISHLVHKTKNVSNRRFIICIYIVLFGMGYIENYLILNQTNAYPYLFVIN